MNYNEETGEFEKEPGYWAIYLPEGVTLCILAFLAVLLFAAGDYPAAPIVIIFIAAFAHISGSIGKDKRIGYRNAFWIGFLLPIVGLIVALASPREIEYFAEEEHPDTIEQVRRLHELKQSGALTDTEFEEQKKKLLNS